MHAPTHSYALLKCVLAALLLCMPWLVGETIAGTNAPAPDDYGFYLKPAMTAGALDLSDSSYRAHTEPVFAKVHDPGDGPNEPLPSSSPLPSEPDTSTRYYLQSWYDTQAHNISGFRSHRYSLIHGAAQTGFCEDKSVYTLRSGDDGLDRLDAVSLAAIRTLSVEPEDAPPPHDVYGTHTVLWELPLGSYKLPFVLEEVQRH